MNEVNVWGFAKWFVGVVAFGISSYIGFNVGQKIWLNNGNNKNNEEKKP